LASFLGVRYQDSIRNTAKLEAAGPVGGRESGVVSLSIGVDLQSTPSRILGTWNPGSQEFAVGSRRSGVGSRRTCSLSCGRGLGWGRCCAV